MSEQVHKKQLRFRNSEKVDSQFCGNLTKSDSLTIENGSHFANCKPLIRLLTFREKRWRAGEEKRSLSF